MDVFTLCMTWVPIIWGQLLGSINNNKAVDDPRPEFSTNIDDPLPCILAVEEPLLPSLPAVEEEPILPSLPAVEEEPLLPSLPAVDDHPLPSLPTTDNEPPLPDLPYHIIVDILSRLPAICVLQCQSVSRPLYILTTTPFFTHLHRHRATPVIVLQSLADSIWYGLMIVHFIEEGTEKKLEAKSMRMDFRYMHKDDSIMLFGSYDGFLLFRNKFKQLQPLFFIWNPITKQKVSLTSRCSYLYACGFYFHALWKEYEVLFLFINGTQFQFQILTLRSKSWRRIGNCSYPPSCERPPVIINGTLYWMVDLSICYRANKVYPSESCSIVSFRTETEEFSTLELPGGCRLGLKISEREQIHLSEIDGQLCLCDPTLWSKLVLWVFNHTTMLWVERHVLILPMVEAHQMFLPWPNHFLTEIVHIKKGELLVRRRNTLLLYNLYLGTFALQFQIKQGYRAIVHTHSLSSFRSDRVISLRRPPSVAARNNKPRKLDSK